MTPPDSGGREVKLCGHVHEVRVCDWPAGHSGAHFYVLGSALDWRLISLPLAQRILAALEQEARSGNVTAQRLEALAAELRAAVERKT